MTIAEVVVVGSWPAPDGTTRAGEVRLSLSGDIRDAASGVVIPATQQQVYLDENGDIAVQVYATDAGEAYWVEERIVGATPRSYSLSVPAAPSGSRAVSDAVTVIGVAALSSVAAVFTVDDVDAWVTGPGLAPLTQILAVIDGSHVTLTQPAAATLSGAHAVIGASVDLAAA